MGFGVLGEVKIDGAWKEISRILNMGLFGASFIVLEKAIHGHFSNWLGDWPRLK